MIARIESLSPLEAVNILIGDIIDELSNGYEFSQYMGVMLQKSSEKQKQANQELVTAIAKIIEQGQEEKVFVSRNPLQLAQFLVSIFQGLSSTQLLLKDKFILPTTEQITSFLEIGYNGE